MKGRPAKISYKAWDERKKSVKILEATARFHCWGIRKSKMQDNPKIAQIETVGICELEDGQVRLVAPERILFLDKRKGEKDATVSRKMD